LCPQHDDEDLRLRAGRRVSLLEAILWTTAFAVSLATPYWFGLSSLLIFFYGTLGALTWRLSRAMPFTLAVVVSLTVAVMVTGIMAAVIQR
jgi:hypothetical protein